MQFNRLIGTCVVLAAAAVCWPAAAQHKPAAHKPAQKTITTKTGLKYVDLKVGKGAVAQKGHEVLVNYIGTLANGTKFDSSFDHGQPFKFLLGAHEVIAGWDEGVAGMRVGGRRKLIVPEGLGYGPSGHPPVIPPHATLTFVVDLLAVQ